MGVANDPIFGFLDPDLRIHIYNFYLATMTIQDSLQASIPIVKAILAGFWSKIWPGHVTCE